MNHDPTDRLARLQRAGADTLRLHQRRVQNAQAKFHDRLASAWQPFVAGAPFAATPLAFWRDAFAYGVDAAQRSVLYWDTLRQRGNQWLEHERAGKPPVLHFDHETIADARTFERPVNFALLRIVPPEGITVDPGRRPYLIIDPRAGHGPGIGGFKDDSQVGVALADGHPVYFVTFFPEPVPGQTLLDVTAAQRAFVRLVRQRHPRSPRPAVVGNCQGGWSAMMLAASDPDSTGPLVINGAPMSYWGGAWSEGEGDNPMRYAGGLLGGSWPASLAADLGNGRFDGAWLVQNFENLNPGNSVFGKYHHLYAHIDTEPPRFLAFERWWGGYYLMNREEIEWITQNLFVGNKLWTGGVAAGSGKVFDLREIKSPIVLFASMGDNITPPQQAFNWVADVYGSTAEIKARGQTIVGLLHPDIGHLGIFVSGAVARREHRQIVSVLKSIEALPPGLYAMNIVESAGADGRPAFEVDFVERRLEDVAAAINRFDRRDELAFEAAATVAEFNQRAYELFARPWVQAMAHETTARMARTMHPLRAERWMLSDLNPWLAWLRAAAPAVKARRQPVDADQPFARAQKLGADMVSAGWDLFRDLRDASAEAAFFQIYGPLLGLRTAQAAPPPKGDAEADLLRELLSGIEQGGFAAAVARTACLLAARGQPLPLQLFETRAALLDDYRELLPDLAPDERRRLRGRQQVIVDHEPQRAIDTLPALLADPADRARYLALFERLLADPRVAAGPGSHPQQLLDRMRERIGELAAQDVHAAPPAAAPAPARRPSTTRRRRSA